MVADIHGNIEALARVADQAEQLIVLGDLLDYVDYHEPARGILGGIFGADLVAPFIAMRGAGDFGALHAYNQGLWNRLADPVGTLTEVVAARYRQVLDAVGPTALLTLGNVDVAEIWNQVAGGVLPYLDGEVVSIAGHTFGFVAGGASRRARSVYPPGQVWRPMVRPAADFAAAVAELGPVDVLCSHIPPNLAQLRFDVVPGRLEMAGPGLLEAIDAHHPALALFGHVHQPLAGRARRGRTECINVGHFQRAERPFQLDSDLLDCH